MKEDDEDEEFVEGEKFHSQIRRVYRGEYGWAVNKKRADMAKVLYEGVHQNTAFTDERRGSGKDYATWIFSEEKGIEEGLFSSNFELMIDATLEPDASIGLHTHQQTEEIYYILSGSIRMTTVSASGEEITVELEPGDAHMIRIGQSHYGTAGPVGARFIAVAVRK